MQVTVELTDGPIALFAKHLAQQSCSHGDISEFLWYLLMEKMQTHPDYRHCSNPACCEDTIPVLTIAKGKHHSNPDCCYEIATTPNPVCPECGAPTVGIVEGLRACEALEDYTRRIEALIEMERALVPGAPEALGIAAQAAVEIAEGIKASKRAKAVAV
jgi:hypothetical protein